MARSLAVDMSCGFRGIRRKQSKVKWHPYKIAVTVEIAETPALENPEALVVAYERWAKIGPRRKETVRRPIGGHAGALWRPLAGPNFAPTASFADLEAIARHAHWKQNPFHRRGPTAGLPTHAEALSVMREIRMDTGDWTRERAAKIAGDLLLVDDVLHRRDIEPVWMVILGDEKIETDFVRPFPGSILSAIPFPIAERERAEDAARRLADACGAKVKSSGMRLEIADPAYLSRTCEETFSQMMGMAFSAARKTINWQCRGKVPEAIQERYDTFAKTIVPGGDICEAAAQLDSFEQTATDFCGYETPAHFDDRAGRSQFSGGWRRCAEAALAVGVIHGCFGGETVHPELDPEDDFALSSLGGM